MSPESDQPNVEIVPGPAEPEVVPEPRPQPPNGSASGSIHRPPPSPEELAEDRYEQQKFKEARLREEGDPVPEGEEDDGKIEWIDPVDAFLSPKAEELPEEEFTILRLNTKLRYRAIPTPRYKKLVKDRTKRRVNPQTKQQTEWTDEDGLKLDLIIESVVNFDFRRQDVIDRFGALDPHGLVEKLLLPGEIEQLALAIAQISGYRQDDLEDEAGNF